jgi:hypothetical protein
MVTLGGVEVPKDTVIVPLGLATEDFDAKDQRRE